MKYALRIMKEDEILNRDTDILYDPLCGPPVTVDGIDGDSVEYVSYLWPHCFRVEKVSKKTKISKRWPNGVSRFSIHDTMIMTSDHLINKMLECC